MGKGGASGVIVVIVLIAAAAVVLPRFRGVAPEPGVFADGWTLAAARERSAEMGRPVLALLTADWCGPCQAFKRGAWSDPAVAAIVRGRTIPVYVDVDRSPDARSFAGVRAVPTTIVLYGGREIGRVEGGMNAGAFRAWLDTTLAKAVDAAVGP